MGDAWALDVISAPVIESQSLGARELASLASTNGQKS